MIHRHGDILLVRFGDAQATDKPGRVTLALGEATGHAHVLESAVLVEDWQAPSREARDFLRAMNVDTARRDFEVLIVDVPAASPLVHQEHAAQEILEGRHIAWRQREYNWFEGEVDIHD